MKYYCNECGEIYDETQMDSGENFFRMPIYVCPNCHSENVEECDRCELCGEYIEPDLVFCKDCSEDIKTTWENMIHGLSKERRISYKDMEEVVCDWIEREVF